MANSKNKHSNFINRQIENSIKDIESMLNVLGVSSINELINSAIPSEVSDGIDTSLQLPDPLSEEDALKLLEIISNKNKLVKSFIGQGYHNTIMPSVIKRNIFENPGWYTSYTAYQSEISQGRLEALFNFQTLTSELTGLPISNASLLDEGTAIAEAASLAYKYHKETRNSLVVIDSLHPQSLEVLTTRMKALNIEIKSCTKNALVDFTDAAAIILQLPSAWGNIYDIIEIVALAHNKGCLVIAALDPMFLVLAGKPAGWGIDIAVGTFQRFGIPLGFGGPHAAYFSTTEALKRLVPGRIVGLSKDTHGRKAYRFALQTREQHIRREKATSNICTSQVFLAVLSSMYAIYHGPEGLKNIAIRILRYTHKLFKQLQDAGLHVYNDNYFDTITWNAGTQAAVIQSELLDAGYNIRRIGQDTLSITFDECTTQKDFETISIILNIKIHSLSLDALSLIKASFPHSMIRIDDLLTQGIFNLYHTETEMMRYIRQLMDKDLALDRTMIPLGSCTMKLNAASELIPLSWEKLNSIHPFAPLDQSLGYQTIITQLEKYLCAITGYDSMSLQPNSGSQGEYAGLLAIKAFYRSRGESHRDVCLIPSSAHGTNPASANLAGLKVVLVSCDKNGNVDVDDLSRKAKEHSNSLAALMITYPSTHGVYEAHVKEICNIVHNYGGQVYIDGANLNALVGLIPIAQLGADVSHLNLHKTFAIPHGGGGPGVGPIGVKTHLAPFLPYNILTPQIPHTANTKFVNIKTQIEDIRVGAVSSAPWGSALVLIISWMYIRMMGAEGLAQASSRAVLHANYIAERLINNYSVLYTGKNGRVAHECIIDAREFKKFGIEVEDIAKRLIDYGFHAPTMSWPVAGTLMIEPTESESKYELDRFCDAMISIRQEIERVITGEWTKEDNPLVHAPHCAKDICTDYWPHAYSRDTAAYPSCSDIDNDHIQEKYWPPVSRIDNAFGDKNLICTCPLINSYSQ